MQPGAASGNKEPHPLPAYRKFSCCLRVWWWQENRGDALRGEDPPWVHLGGTPKASQSHPMSGTWENQTPEYEFPLLLAVPWGQTALKAATCSYSYILNDSRNNLLTKPPTPCWQERGVSLCRRFDPSRDPNYSIHFHF